MGHLQMLVERGDEEEDLVETLQFEQLQVMGQKGCCGGQVVEGDGWSVVQFCPHDTAVVDQRVSLALQLHPLEVYVRRDWHSQSVLVRVAHPSRQCGV